MVGYSSITRAAVCALYIYELIKLVISAAESLAIVTAYFSEIPEILDRALISRVILTEAMANNPRTTIITVNLKPIFIA